MNPTVGHSGRIGGFPSYADLVAANYAIRAPRLVSMGEITWAFSGPDGVQRTVRHEPRLTCVDFLALRDAAVAGLGVALLPEHTCRSELAKGGLVHVFPQWDTVDGIVHLVFTTRRGLPPVVRAFIDHLAEAFQLGNIVS